MDAAWVWVSDAVHGSGQVKERRVKALKEAAHAALETALTTQDVETLRLSTEAAWRSEQDAERLRARAVSACEEEIARAQRMLAKAQGMLQRVQANAEPGGASGGGARGGEHGEQGHAMRHGGAGGGAGRRGREHTGEGGGWRGTT